MSKFIVSKIIQVYKIGARHLMVSAICATVEYITFLILLQIFEFSLTNSYIIAFSSATIIGYLGHNFYTFRVGAFSEKTALIFTIQAISSFSLGYFFLSLILQFGVPVWLAKGMQLMCTFIFNFSFGNYVTFRR